MRFAGYRGFGRIATWLATWFFPPHYLRDELGSMSERGYVSPKATIYHSDLRLTRGSFIDDRCLVFQCGEGSYVSLGFKARIYRDTIIETGEGGNITIDERASIHPRCQLNAYVAPIYIGKSVMIAANCAFYSYDHGVKADIAIGKQPVSTKGGIHIGDDAWIGTGAIVLSGVTIGEGAVIGAGSVVTHNIPAGAIAVGVPARVVKMRGEC